LIYPQNLKEGETRVKSRVSETAGLRGKGKRRDEKISLGVKKRSRSRKKPEKKIQLPLRRVKRRRRTATGCEKISKQEEKVPHRQHYIEKQVEGLSRTIKRRYKAIN